MKDKWIRYFKNLAVSVSRNSPCLSRQVGAVLVADKRILATGYNGPPSGISHCQFCPRTQSGANLELCIALHAEENALLDCGMRGVACAGADMFCTLMPCNECLKKLIQCRIASLYVAEYYELPDEGESMRTRLLSEGNIAVNII